MILEVLEITIEGDLDKSGKTTSTSLQHGEC
jgi:hypothetical protein